MDMDPNPTRFERRRSAGRCLVGVALLVLGSLHGGCAAKSPAEDLRTVTPGHVYDELFPRYIELCALSQIRPLEEKNGGNAGHAVIYLKGACHVPGAPYPAIALCEEPSNDRNDLNHGVGISVDKMFRNVNWMSVPGKHLFMDGSRRPGVPVSASDRETTIQEALDLELFRGIELHEQYMTEKPADVSVAEFVARKALGTDYAIRYGRSAFCSRVPVSEPVLVEVLDELNEMNRIYASGEADYNWSGYNDNCAHLVRNSMAAGHIWKRKSIGSIRLRQFFNLAVPANEFILLAERVNDYPFEKRKKVLRSKVNVTSLKQNRWLPFRHGGLLKVEPVLHPNDLYDTQMELLVLEAPLWKPRTRAVDRMLDDPNFTNLLSNLEHFEQRYLDALEDRSERSDWGALDELYFDTIANQLAELRTQRARLRELQVSDEGVSEAR